MVPVAEANNYLPLLFGIGAGFGVLGIIAGFGFGYAMLLNQTRANAAAAKENRESSREVQQQISVLERDVASFRERVVSSYATSEVLVRLEEKMISSINHLGDRVDNIGTLITQFMSRYHDAKL